MVAGGTSTGRQSFEHPLSERPGQRDLLREHFHAVGVEMERLASAETATVVAIWIGEVTGELNRISREFEDLGRWPTLIELRQE